MDENKNIQGSSAIESQTKKDIHPTNETVPDYTDPDAYLDEYMYDELYYDSMCMSCQHWNGYMCNAENGNCNYEPF